MEESRESWSNVEERFVIFHTIYQSMYALLVWVINTLWINF